MSGGRVWEHPVGDAFAVHLDLDGADVEQLPGAAEGGVGEALGFAGGPDVGAGAGAVFEEIEQEGLGAFEGLGRGAAT
jgi:hypothetical protein